MNIESRSYRLMEFGLNYIRGLGSALFIFTAGLLSPRHRSFIRVIAGHMGWLYKPVIPIVPEIAPDHAIGSKVAHTLVEMESLDGNVSLLELSLIDQMLRKIKPQNVFELGTFDGRTTLNMAWNVGDSSRVWTLDLPGDKVGRTGLPIAAGDKVYIEKETSGARFRGDSVEGKITQLYGDTATFDFSPYYDSIDVVFVDAAHSYEYVLSDTQNALKLLRGGEGLILWHDYDAYDGVTKALNELFQTNPRFAGMRRIRGTHLVYLVLGKEE